MTSLKNIQQKIKTSTDLKSLVRIMKALAASNIHQYTNAQKSFSEYFRTIELGMQAVLQFGREKITLKEANAQGPIGCILLTSDLGLCGQFNHQIFSFFQKKQEEWKIFDAHFPFLILGEEKKEMETNLHSAEKRLSYPISIAGIPALLHELLDAINQWIVQRDTHRIYLFYNKPTSANSYAPYVQKLLPLDSLWFADLHTRKWNSRSLPQFAIDSNVLFSALLQEYFFLVLYQAIIDSYISENVSRWQSMSIAEKHIADFTDDLKMQFHHQWQESITEEMLDIASGFEALRKKNS